MPSMYRAVMTFACCAGSDSISNSILARSLSIRMTARISSSCRSRICDTPSAILSFVAPPGSASSLGVIRVSSSSSPCIRSRSLAICFSLTVRSWSCFFVTVSPHPFLAVLLIVFLQSDIRGYVRLRHRPDIRIWILYLNKSRKNRRYKTPCFITCHSPRLSPRLQKSSVSTNIHLLLHL